MWSSPVWSGMSLVTRAAPRASRNGPSGLSATATPIAPPGTVAWSTATYQKNRPSRSTTAPAFAPPRAHVNRSTASSGPCERHVRRSVEEKHNQSRITYWSTPAGASSWPVYR